MSRSLIIYFSRADENYAVGYIEKGNTEYVAEFVQELTGADMFKVESAVPYSKDYRTCIKEAKERIGNAPIKEKLADISAYDTVFIMSPIYWGTYAPEIETALEGKIILNNTDLDIIRDYATPKVSKGLSEAKIARAKAMLASGYYTQADIAEQFGISPTTLMRYVNAD